MPEGVCAKSLGHRILELRAQICFIYWSFLRYGERSMLGFENTKLILPKERRPRLYGLQIACNYFSEYKLLRAINELKKILNLEVFC